MAIPTKFGVDVNTPEPLTVKIDISERAMFFGLTAFIIGAIAVKKIKKG